jgi:hypothetical protein
MKINSPDIYSLKLNESIGGSVGMGYSGEIGLLSPWTPQIEIFDKTFIGSDFNTRDLGVGFDNTDATMEIIPFETSTNIQIINAMVVNKGNGTSWASRVDVPLCLYGIGTDPGGKFVHCATITAKGDSNVSWISQGSGSQFTTYFTQNYEVSRGKFPTFARGIYLGCHIGSVWPIETYTGFSSIRVFGAFVRYPNRPGDLL